MKEPIPERIIITNVFPEGKPQVKAETHLVRETAQGKFQAKVSGAWISVEKNHQGGFHMTRKIGIPHIPGF